MDHFGSYFLLYHLKNPTGGSNFSFLFHNLASSPRVVQIDRSNGSFGFMLVGHSPVMIESIDPGGAAEKAGLQPGDRIIRLNGLDVRKKTHDQLIMLMKGSGSAPTIAIESGQPIPSSGV